MGWTRGAIASLICLLLAGGAMAEGDSQAIDPAAVRVLDGDSIRYEGKSYRLIGFNAPETAKAACEREQDLGGQAARRLKELIASDVAELQTVPCACRPGTDGTPACNYGRACAILRVDGVDVGKTLINEGLAVPFICGRTRCPPTPRPWCS